MQNRVVVDASVMIAAVSPLEAHHSDALAFLNAIHAQRIMLVEPTHFLLELYSVCTRSPRRLRELGFLTEDDPIEIQFHPIGEFELERMLAWLSTACPGKSPKRGADLAFLLVAWDAKLPLVTLDNVLYGFRDCGVDVNYPAEFLQR